VLAVGTYAEPDEAVVRSDAPLDSGDIPLHLVECTERFEEFQSEMTEVGFS
jgi:hypothetical protein